MILAEHVKAQAADKQTQEADTETCPAASQRKNRLGDKLYRWGCAVTRISWVGGLCAPCAGGQGIRAWRGKEWDIIGS